MRDDLPQRATGFNMEAAFTGLGTRGGRGVEGKSLANQLLARLVEMTHPIAGELMADRLALDRGWRLLRRLVEQPNGASESVQRFLEQHARRPPPNCVSTEELAHPLLGSDADVDSDSMDEFFDSISNGPVRVVRTDGASTNYPWEKKG